LLRSDFYQAKKYNHNFGLGAVAGFVQNFLINQGALINTVLGSNGIDCASNRSAIRLLDHDNQFTGVIARMNFYTLQTSNKIRNAVEKIRIIENNETANVNFLSHFRHLTHWAGR